MSSTTKESVATETTSSTSDDRYQNQYQKQDNNDQDVIVEKLYNFIKNNDDNDDDKNDNFINNLNIETTTTTKLKNDTNNNDVIDDDDDNLLIEKVNDTINNDNDDNNKQTKIVDNNLSNNNNKNNDDEDTQDVVIINNDNNNNVDNNNVDDDYDDKSSTTITNSTNTNNNDLNPLDKITQRKSLDYLKELFNDRERLLMMPIGLFHHTLRLLDQEIVRIRTSLIHIDGSIDERKSIKLPEPDGNIIQKTLRISIPIDKYPDYNFVGRIIGPRGLTIQELENECGCKLYVRGKGSLRNKEKEEKLRGQTNWEHLNEELHVMIVVEDTSNRIDLKLNYAREQIEKLIDSVIMQKDDFKMRQLAELAILNDKFNIKNKSPPLQLNKNRQNNLLFNQIKNSSTTSTLSTSPSPSSSSSSSLQTNPLLIDTTSLPFGGGLASLANQQQQQQPSTSPQTLATLFYPNNHQLFQSQYTPSSATATTTVPPPPTLFPTIEQTLFSNHQQQLLQQQQPQQPSNQDLFTIMATAAATAASLHGYNNLNATGIVNPIVDSLYHYQRPHQQLQQQQRYHPYHMNIKRKHPE